MTVLETTVTRGDDAIPLVMAAGDDRGPVMVVVPSIFGIDDGLRDQMSELAQPGGVAMALDPFFRTEPGPLPTDDPSKAFARLQQTDLKASYADFRHVLEVARTHEQGNGRIAALGICFGGPFCFMAARDGAVDGVVTWHGSRLDQYVERAGEMRCPMKLHFGDVDPVVPLEAVERVRAAFEGRDDVEIVVHPGATHGFSQRSASAYDAAAEKAGMEAAHGLLAQLRTDAE